MESVKEKGGFSGSTLKIVAVIAMLIDHTAAVVLVRMLRVEWDEGFYVIYSLMRDIGRLGFPIFCFLLTEGFHRSRNLKKYAMRLGIFALVSEIPFDLAVTGHLFHFGYQNVYFTLLLGLTALCAFRFLERHMQMGAEKELPVGLRIFLVVAGMMSAAFLVLYLTRWDGGRYGIKGYFVCYGAVCAFMAAALVLYRVKCGARQAQTVGACLAAMAVCIFLAEVLCTDYAGMGVLTICVMYCLRRWKALSMAAGCAVLCVMNMNELPAFFAILPIALYNGRRGLKMKYFFYAFYPLHLLLLYLAAVLMGMGGISLL